MFCSVEALLTYLVAFWQAILLYAVAAELLSGRWCMQSWWATNLSYGQFECTA